MRDYDQRLIDLRYEVSAVEGTCDVNPYLPPGSSVVYNDYKASFRGREDLVPSNHHRPTLYGAWYYKAVVHPFDLMGYFHYTCSSPSGMKKVAIRRASGKANISDVYLHPYLTSQSVGGQYRLRPNGTSQLQAETTDAVLAALSSADINIGQTLGEISETGSLLLQRGLQLAYLVKALRQHKLKDAFGIITGGALGIRKVKRSSDRKLGLEVYRPEKPGAIDRAASFYLEGKFGWAPLISDLTALANGAIKKATDSAGFPVMSVTRQRTNQPYIGPGTYISTNVHREGKCEMGCKMSVSYTVSNSFLAGLNSLGLVNPFATGWELLPLSFLVDWLVNVGGFLSGLTAPVGLDFLHGYTTTWVKNDIYATSNYVAKQWNVPFGKLPSVNVRSYGFRRVPFLSFPKPGLWINLSLNPSQVTTLIALLNQGR